MSGAPGTFASNLVAELSPANNGPQGQALAAAMGSVQDAEMQLLRVAALSRLPQWCPDDALDAAGAWLRLERLPLEVNGTTTTGYRGRLCAAWPTWAIAGSKGAIIGSLQAWGVPDVQIFNDYEISPPFPGSWYTRFRVKLGPNFGGFGWGVGSDPTLAEQRQIKHQVLRWKWAWSYPVDVVLDYGGGFSFTFPIGAIIGHGFIIGRSTIGGYDPL